MKTIYFLLFSVWFCINSVNTYGQNGQAQIVPSKIIPIQKKYGGETYNIYGWTESSKQIGVINIRRLDMEKSKERCICDTWNYGADFLTEVMKSVFPQGKRNETANRGILTFIFVIEVASGQIIDVEFILRRVSLSEEEESLTAVTLKEIYQLETLLKKHQFKMDNCDCTKFKYGSVTFSVPLKTMKE